MKEATNVQKTKKKKVYNQKDVKNSPTKVWTKQVKYLPKLKAEIVFY